MEVPDSWKKENAMPLLYRTEGGLKQLQPSQPTLSPQNNYGTNSPVSNVQTHEGQESDWEELEWIFHRQIVIGKHDCIL